MWTQFRRKQMRRGLVSLVVLGCLWVVPAQQQPQQPVSSPPARTDDDEVVKITTNLVQVDAVVTDGDGRVVTNLLPADFNLVVNGKKQEITSFSFNGLTSVKRVNTGTDPKSPPIPNITSRQVANTYALVVDDYCMEFEYFVNARKLVEKFINEKLQPTDAAAVISTRAGTGTLQQFTTDRRVLNAAIRNMRWQPCRTQPISFSGSSAEGDDAKITQANSERENEAFNRNAYGVTAIGTLDYVAQGLQDLPGRKAILMLSQGLPILSPKTTELDGDVWHRLRRVIEKANRASAVIYTIHLRGLDPLFFDVTDGKAALAPSAMSADRGLLASRRKEFNFGQEGLIYFAESTGGFAVRNTNDFSGGMSRVVEDQQGYYLLGYRPEEGTFTREGTPKFNSIKITLNNRSGYRVRTRNGFAGRELPTAGDSKGTPQDQLVKALRSPVGAGGVALRMTSLFVNQPSGQLQVRSLLHLAAGDLNFKTESDEWRTAGFDVAIVTLGADGVVVDQLTRIQTLRVRADRYDEIVKEGLVYILDVPVKKSGPYEMRVAVRDHGSNRIGSARQFVEVPDLAKDRLVISDLVISGHGASGPEQGIGGVPVSGSLASQSGPAIRKFKSDMTVDYGFEVHGLKDAGNKGWLVQMRVYRDGKEEFAGKPQPLATTAAGQQVVSSGGSFQLGRAMQPGWYTLEISVIDGAKKRKQAIQWIDFEIAD